MSEGDDLNTSLCLVENPSSNTNCLNFDNIDKLMEENNYQQVSSYSQEKNQINVFLAQDNSSDNDNFNLEMQNRRKEKAGYSKTISSNYLNSNFKSKECHEYNSLADLEQNDETKLGSLNRTSVTNETKENLNLKVHKRQKRNSFQFGKNFKDEKRETNLSNVDDSENRRSFLNFNKDFKENDSKHEIISINTPTMFEMNNKDSSDDGNNVSNIKPKCNDDNKENNVSFENDRLFINSEEDKFHPSEIIENTENKETQIKKIIDNQSDHIEKEKVLPLANYVEIMYDQTSERVKKRSEQMKKMKEKLHRQDLKEKSEVENYGVEVENIFIQTEKIENNKESLLEQVINSNNHNEENEVQNDAELVISDLDCDLENEETPIQKNNNQNNVPQKPIGNNNKSFIPLTNNLLIKSHIKQDNNTPSYLMALNQYAPSEEPEEIQENDSTHRRVNSFMKVNYQVNDVIEEENSENCTDSEFSNRKRNSKTNKKKNLTNSGSDKKAIISNYNQPMNLNLAYFNMMEKVNSKSEVPSNYVNRFNPNENNDFLEKSHKISRSDLCNIQTNMQKISEELEKRIKEQEENSKIMKNIKKRLILDRLLKSNSLHEFKSNLEPDKYIINSIFDSSLKRQTPKNSIGLNENFISFKKKTPSDTNKIVDYGIKIDQSSSISPSQKNLISKEENLSNKYRNYSYRKSDQEIKEFKFEQDLSDIVIEKSPVSKDFNKHKRGSSFFNTEDLKVSKQGQFNFEKSVNKNLCNIFINLNTEKSSNVQEFDSNSESCTKFNESNLEIIRLSKNKKDIILNCLENPSPCSYNINDNSTNKNDKLGSDFNFDFNFKDSPLIYKSDLKTNCRNSSVDFRNLKKNKNLDGLQEISNTVEIIANKFKLIENEANRTKSNLSVSNQILIQIDSNKNKSDEILKDRLQGNNTFTSKHNKNSKDFIFTVKNVPKIKNSSINNTRKKHFKTPSCVNINYQLSLNSNIIPHSQTSNQPVAQIIKKNSKTRSNSFCRNQFKGAMNSYISEIEKIVKNPNNQGKIKNSPKIHKGPKNELKQYLTFSGTKEHLHTPNNLIKSNYASNLSHHEKSNSFRINSENSGTNIINNVIGSKKTSVIEAMKNLKFQKSSFDHQKYSLERLNKSKSKLFSLLVELDSNKKKYEFKGLYEINEEKNSLNKIYSTNFYPSTIDFIEIKDLLTFDSELKVFKKINNETKRLNEEVHAFSLYFKKPNKYDK